MAPCATGNMQLPLGQRGQPWSPPPVADPQTAPAAAGDLPGHNPRYRGGRPSSTRWSLGCSATIRAALAGSALRRRCQVLTEFVARAVAMLAQTLAILGTSTPPGEARGSALLLAADGGCGHPGRGDPARRQADEGAPSDDGRREEGGVRADVPSIGPSAERKPRSSPPPARRRVRAAAGRLRLPPMSPPREVNRSLVNREADGYGLSSATLFELGEAGAVVSTEVAV